MPWRSNVKAFIKEPQNIILVILFAVLCFLTLVPLVSLLRDTFVAHPAELMIIKNAKAGDFTFFHWYKIFFDGKNSWNLFYSPFWNTIKVSLGSCVIAILLGGAMAWLVARSNIRFKPIISTIFVFPYIMPAWTLAMAWLNFFRNSYIGGKPGLFTAFTGIEMANWFAYGEFPIIMVTGLHYAPFAYILIGGILQNMDANLEEAAMLLHASRFKILRKVTFPIVVPAVFSAFLLTFASSMSAFAVPAFLGTPVRYYVLTTQLYRTLNGVNQGYGYVMTLVMLAVGLCILAFNQWFVGKRKSFITVTGKSSQAALVNLYKARMPVSIIVLVLLLLIAVLPLVSFAVESFTMETGNYHLSNFTAVFWLGKGSTDIANAEPGILRNKYLYQGLWNSIKLSLCCSFVAGTCGVLCGYAVVKKRGSRLSEIVNGLAFFPYLMPAMAFSAIYLSMFSRQNGFVPPLYGTFLLLVIIGSVKYLPFASRAGVNAMLQLSNEIEEAALIQGVGWWKRMVRIIFPIQRTSFLAGYLLPFISCMRELSLFILLVTPANRVLTTMLFQYNEKGWNQYANAINLLIIIVVLFFNFVINKLTGASIDKGIGGA
ncbi:MAG: ABC transporter permease [Treponema sp.]|uniref:ABC transporter permease n=1 Tax=Treponema sp. TaxID=166 RepID=UPI003FA2255E